MSELVKFIRLTGEETKNGLMKVENKKGEIIVSRYKYDIFRYQEFASCNFLGGRYE